MISLSFFLCVKFKLDTTLGFAARRAERAEADYERWKARAAAADLRFVLQLFFLFFFFFCICVYRSFMLIAYEARACTATLSRFALCIAVARTRWVGMRAPLVHLLTTKGDY